MLKRKQWASAVRRGRKHAKYDKDAASPEAKDKEKLEEEPSGRREGETNKKMRIVKRTRKRKKTNYCSGDVTSHHCPSPLEEFSDSDIDLDCGNEKKKEQHHDHSYNNPSSALFTTTTSSSFTPRPLIVPSRCCHHDTSEYNYDEYSSSPSISSSGSSSSPSRSPVHYGRRKKKRKHINNNNMRAVKKEGRRRRRRRGTKCLGKQAKRRISFMAAVGIKLLIALLTTQPLIRSCV